MDPRIKNYSFKNILIILTILIIPILSTGKTLDPNLHIQHIALTAVLILFMAHFALHKSRLAIHNKGVKYFIYCFIFYLIYSSISVVISRNISDAIFQFSTYALFFTLAGTFLFFENSDKAFLLVSRSVTILSIVIAIPAFAQLMELISSKDLVFPESTYAVQSFFPHRNLLSQLLLFSLPFTGYSIVMEKRYWHYVGILAFNLSLLLLILLSNRATWLGLIAIGSGIIFVLLLRKEGGELIRRSRIIFLSTIAVLFVSILVFNVYSDTESLKSHTQNTLNFEQGSTKDRLELWSRTVKLIGENPILGNGLGSWKIDILKYGNSGLASEDNTTFYQRPHNDFLWLAAEQGLIGAALYILLFCLIIFQLLKCLRGELSNTKRNQLLVILSLTLGFIIFSMFSFPRERISHNILLFSSWGLFLNILNSKEITGVIKARKQQNIILLSIPLLLIILMLGIVRFNGEVHAKKAILLKKESQFQECIHEIEKAQSFFYKIDATSTPLTWYLALSYYKIRSYKEAISQFENAVRINPYHIYVLNDYAGCLSKLNQSDKALEFYKKAIDIAPNFTEPKLNMCAIYFSKNDFENAFEVLKTTDIESTLPRYKKTVTIILRKLIEQELAAVPKRKDLRGLYHKEKNNYYFYKNLLSIAQINNLSARQLVNRPIHLKN